MRIHSLSEECLVQSCVLILSADSLWHEMMHESLASRGLRVNSFYTAREVREWSRSERSDIVVCLIDEALGDMDGADALRYLFLAGFHPDAVLHFGHQYQAREKEQGFPEGTIYLPKADYMRDLIPLICESIICRIHAEFKLSFEISGEADKLIGERIRLLDLYSTEIISRQKWDRTVLYISQACKIILGYDPEEVTGKSLYRFIHPDDLPALRQNHIKLIETKTRIFNEVCRMRCKDGRYVWIESGCRVIYDGETGLADEIISISKEITEKREMEEMTKAKQVAEQANKAKSEFLANMSHEIRNPLSAVLGMARTLEKTSLDDEQKGYLKSILIASGNLMTILNDILDYSKIESKSMDVIYHHFNVRDMVNELVNIHMPQAEEKNNRVLVCFDDGLPETIYADKQKVEQALSNLLSNANKFTANGTVTISVALIHGEEHENLLEFKVEDTGIGVRKEDIPGMFVSFRQRDLSAKKEYQGTGLGLSIVKSLVDLMSGRVGFESEPDKGSMVYFRIPLSESVERAGDRDESKPGQGVDKLLRFLVVEDDAINQLYLAGFLRSMGWDVDTAYNGLTALDFFEPGKYDLILMDGQMPRMDGFEATRKIREMEGKGRRTPIIAISGYAIPGDKDRFLEAGMDEYLSKPIDEHSLLEVITRLTAGQYDSPS